MFSQYRINIIDILMLTISKKKYVLLMNENQKRAYILRNRKHSIDKFRQTAQGAASKISSLYVDAKLHTSFTITSAIYFLLNIS